LSAIKPLFAEQVSEAFVPPDLKDFCLSDLDLSSTPIFDVLDRAQTPSLMSPFQVIFVRNVRQLYTRNVSELFTELGRAGFRVDTILEPKAGFGEKLPATIVWRARKEGV
jgi:hypothetical protein